MRPFYLPRVVCVLGISLSLFLASCAASDDETIPSTASAPDVFGLDESDSAENLYFEALRLQSAGLLRRERMDALQRQLATVDEVYAEDPDHEALLRKAILSHLRLAAAEVRREDIPVLEAQEARAYGRRLHRAGVRAADQGAAGTVLIAGMLGMPTSKEEMVFIVAIPVGGYLLVKGAMTLKRAAFLLRGFRNVDEVVKGATELGLQVRRVEDVSALRTAVASKDAELRSVARGVDAYASADLLQSRLKRFVTQEIKPEFDEPFEFFIHGTTYARAVTFKPGKGLRLFTATDPQVSLFFAHRTVGREGGRAGAVVIALPRDVAARLRKEDLLFTEPVPDMPRFLQTIFEPGAVETLKNQGFIEALPDGFFDP